MHAGIQRRCVDVFVRLRAGLCDARAYALAGVEGGRYGSYWERFILGWLCGFRRGRTIRHGTAAYIL